MIAGLILLFVGLMFIAIGVILPRVALRLHEAIQTIPTAMQDMASSLVPGLETGLRLRAMLPRLARIALGLGGLFLAFSIFAFTTQTTPLWLTVFSYIMLLVLVVLAVGLFLLIKRFAPMLRELTQFTKGRL